MVSIAEARSQMHYQVILGNVAAVEVMQRGLVEDVITALTTCQEATKTVRQIQMHNCEGCNCGFFSMR
jgi:hypothetical protein